MFYKTFRFCRLFYARISMYLLLCIYTLHTLSKCEQNDDMYIFPSNAWNLFFAELLKCNHEKTFPIYYSFKEVISIETSIPMDSVKVYAMYRRIRIHYFYLQTQ